MGAQVAPAPNGDHVKINLTETEHPKIDLTQSHTKDGQNSRDTWLASQGVNSLADQVNSDPNSKFNSTQNSVVTFNLLLGAATIEQHFSQLQFLKGMDSAERQVFQLAFLEKYGKSAVDYAADKVSPGYAIAVNRALGLEENQAQNLYVARESARNGDSQQMFYLLDGLSKNKIDLMLSFDELTHASGKRLTDLVDKHMSNAEKKEFQTLCQGTKYSADAVAVFRALCHHDTNRGPLDGVFAESIELNLDAAYSRISSPAEFRLMQEEFNKYGGLGSVLSKELGTEAADLRGLIKYKVQAEERSKFIDKLP